VEVLQTVINALVVGVVGLALARMTQALREDVTVQISGLRAAVHEVRNELRSEIREVRSDLQAEIREVRSDLTRVALAVGAERRAGRQ
jgi:hypothetical protein